MCEKTRAQNLAATHVHKYLKRLDRIIATTPFGPTDLRTLELSGYNEWLQQTIEDPDPELSYDATIDLGNL